MTNAILLMTHTWSDHIGGQFDELCTVPGAEAWILVDDRCEDPAAIRTLYQRCHSFRFDALARLPYPMLATGSLRGNAHIPVLDFYSHHNHFDYYWFMEHDVRYTGQWRALFDLFHPFDHDFITTHLRWYRQEPGWAWWDTFKPAGVPIDRVGWVRSFNVIYRASNEALAFLHRELPRGWQGHHEVLIATVLHYHGFQLLDFGGEGDFVPAGFENRLYTSPDNTNGDLTNGEGTVRYRPAFLSPGDLENKLYHPVRAASVKDVDARFRETR